MHSNTYICSHPSVGFCKKSLPVFQDAVFLWKHWILGSSERAVAKFYPDRVCRIRKDIETFFEAQVDDCLGLCQFLSDIIIEHSIRTLETSCFTT